MIEIYEDRVVVLPGWTTYDFLITDPMGEDSTVMDQIIALMYGWA